MNYYGYSNIFNILMELSVGEIMKENKPFECPVVLDKIKAEREKLIASLSDFNIPEDEKQFILRKINNMSEKLVRAGRYAKDTYED